METKSLIASAIFLTLAILMTFMSVFGSLDDLVQNKKIDQRFAMTFYALTAAAWAIFYMLHTNLN